MGKCQIISVQWVGVGLTALVLLEGSIAEYVDVKSDIVDDFENVEVKAVRDTVNGEIDVTATGSDLTDVRLLVQELSCDVTSA